MSRARPTLSVIGAGRVGQALGRVFASAGYPIGTVACRSADAARRAVQFIGAGTPRSIGRLPAIDGGVVLVTTPDDALADVASRLAARETSFSGTTVLHVSGALGASVLEPLRRRGASIGSMHPLQSFATAELGAARLAGSVFAVEGERAAVSEAVRLARDAGGRPVRLKAGSKPLYHAAAVMASGHVTALLDASLQAMRAAGLDEDEALAAVLPLVLGTIANIRERGTRSALTGPFARGDEGTIERNRAALLGVDEALVAIYELLGARSRVIVRR